jgi:hypothetical protein
VKAIPLLFGTKTPRGPERKGDTDDMSVKGKKKKVVGEVFLSYKKLLPF